MLEKLKIQLASSDEKCIFFSTYFFWPNFKTLSKKTYGSHLSLHCYDISLPTGTNDYRASSWDLAW